MPLKLPKPVNCNHPAPLLDRAAGDTAVVVIDDHQTIAQLLADFVDRHEGFQCVGTSYSGTEGIRLIEDHKPDLVILDLQLGDVSGLEVLERIKNHRPEPKILIFSALVNEALVGFTLRSKIDAFVEKGVPMEQLTDALERIRRGEVYFSPTASKSLRQIVHRRKYANLDHNDLVALRLVAQQQPIKHIAHELGLSQSGAYKLVDRLLAKTGSANTAQLLHQAVLLGLVTPE